MTANELAPPAKTAAAPTHFTSFSMTYSWAYGVTTVPERATTHLPQTLASLARGGFTEPRLFVDGGRLAQGFFPCTWRGGDRVGPFGNWYMSLLELYVRFPASHRYALFQDDVVCVQGLRSYLDSCKFPERGYWNLFTFLDSDRVTTNKKGWVEGPMMCMGVDPAESWQSGRGALGLVFSREGVQLLLGAQSMVQKPASATHPRDKIDGAVVTAMNIAGWREYIHSPSLLSHTGTVTSIQEPGKAGKVWKSNATSFPGESVDIRRLMSGVVT